MDHKYVSCLFRDSPDSTSLIVTDLYLEIHAETWFKPLKEESFMAIIFPCEVFAVFTETGNDCHSFAGASDEIDQFDHGIIALLEDPTAFNKCVTTSLPLTMRFLLVVG